jgi:hypothetical protein
MDALDAVWPDAVAAVAWSRGTSFAGLRAFIFAYPIVLPMTAIHRKHYGARSQRPRANDEGSR